MSEKNFIKINKLIEEKKINEAQFELSKLGNSYNENPEYLYLRSKIFFMGKLYYIAIDTLLIALEFEQNNKFYKLISDIYKVLGNRKLSTELLDPNLRLNTANSLKDQLEDIHKFSSLPNEYRYYLCELYQLFLV